MATVALRGLSRQYRGVDTAALDGLSLEVADGELLVLVGPSGCGKSTALRLVAGLDTPDAGSIEIDGKDLARVPPQERDVAMVFQGYALYPHLSVRDNVAFPLKMRGVAVAERARRVDEAAEMLGLGKLLNRRPSELSGGERQRVAMGRAIVRKPKVFLFDEPLSNLDAALRGQLRVELGALLRRLGTTSLYVTHDQVEAMTLGDRIAVLRGGKLQQVGRPREIYQDPENDFVAGFLGAPPMNWIDMVRDGEGHLRGAGAVFPLPSDRALPAKLKAGVRPEHLSLGRDTRRASDAVAMSAVVVATEPLGSETHVLADAAGTWLRAKVAGFDAVARGEPIELFVSPSSILWFDGETGARCRGDT